MRKAHSRLFFVAALLVAGAASAADRKTIGRIERQDARLDSLVPKDAVVEVLAEGFRWSEGPAWDKAARRNYGMWSSPIK